mgnify:CR=1 FL=1
MVKTLQNFSVVAQNDATDSNNAIHSDDIAQKLGFTGGLVPGVTVYGYLTRPLVEFFGDCLLYTSPSPRDGLLSRMPSSA